MSDFRPPTDAEIAALITDYGVPVYLQIGDDGPLALGPLTLGWLDRDMPSTAAAIASLLRQAADALENP